MRLKDQIREVEAVHRIAVHEVTGKRLSERTRQRLVRQLNTGIDLADAALARLVHLRGYLFSLRDSLETNEESIKRLLG